MAKRMGHCERLGVPHQGASTPSEPANALGPPARMSTGYFLPIGDRRGRLSLVCPCPGPHLMLPSEPGRDPGRDSRVRPGGLPRKRPAFSSCELTSCARNAQDTHFTSTAKAPDCKLSSPCLLQGFGGDVLMESGPCAKRITDPNACAFSLLTSLLKMCTNLRKTPLLPKPMASADSGPFP